MNTYKLAVFDLDGTILNTLEDLADSVNWMLEKFGYPVHTYAEVRQMVGNGLWKLVERALPAGSSEKQIQEAFDAFTPHYQEFCNVKTGPYAGIPELVKKLREAGYLTAVNTNKKAAQTEVLMEAYFPGLFDEILGEGIGFEKKPSPEAVFHILKKLAIQPEEAVYIGDSDVDLQTARNAGLDPIIVSWGFRDRDYMVAKGATVIADTMEELENLLIR